MELADHLFMEAALELARKADQREEVPVGAVIVREEKIIAEGSNEVEARQDATAHAEVLALQQAQANLGDWRLSECTLYVTKEPCPMCAGAILQTRMKRVVFGVSDPKMGGVGGALNILAIPGANHRCEVTSGIKAEESRLLLQEFFRRQRSRGKDSTDGGAS